MSYKDLGSTLPREFLAELLEAPVMMSLAQAAKYVGLSESRTRVLLRTRQLVGAGGSKQGQQRCVIPRASVIVYWERRLALQHQHKG
jgi:hypothetical protein